MSFNRQYREPWPRAAGAVLVLLLAATGSIVAQVGDESLYRKEIDAWRKNRLDRLTAEDGWLTLVGLFWLQEGANRMGSDPSDTVVFPQDKAPAAVGNILLKGNELWLEVEPDVEILHSGEPVRRMRLRPDSQEDPTILESGDLTFFIIERDGRFAVRMKDKNHPPRHEFEGIDSYPIESRWRITGRFAAYDPPKKLPIPTVLGTVSHQTSWGKVLFDVDGQQLSLDAVAEPGAERLFLIFADETTGVETYGGGRYLYADAPNHDGEVILDFNKAYNPPCVFTPYATCPLPPRPNRLPVRIEAGEKKLH